MDGPIDIDKQRLRESKKISIIDSAIISLIIPAIAVTLLFAYNGGYNSYFGIPVYFTAATPSALLNNIPQMYYVLALLLAFVILIRISRWHISVRAKKKKSNNFYPAVYFIVLSVLCLITLISGIIEAELYLILLSALFLIVCIIYSCFSINYIKKYKNIYVSNDAESFVPRIVSSSRIVRSMIVVLFLGLCFLLTYLYGYFKASSQEYFYVTESSNAIIALYNDSVITVNISKQNDTYIFTNYELLPLENLKFKLINTGCINSDPPIPYTSFDYSRIFRNP